MSRVISWLFAIAFILGLLAAASFVTAHYRARELLGNNAPVRGPETTFAWDGVPDVRGRPRAWVLTYRQIRLAGVPRVRIVISPTGRVLSVTPPDLSGRIDVYRRSQEP